MANKTIKLALVMALIIALLPSVAAVHNFSVNLVNYWGADGGNWTEDNHGNNSNIKVVGSVEMNTTSVNPTLGNSFGMLYATNGDNYYQMANTGALAGSASFSICFWMRVNKVHAAADHTAIWAWGKTSGGGVVSRWELSTTYHLGTDWSAEFTSTGMYSSSWSHYCTLWDGTNLTYYQNATKMASNSTSINVPAGDANITMSKLWAVAYYSPDGEWDELGFWSNKTLNETEITTLYNNGTGFNYTGMIALAGAPPAAPTANFTVEARDQNGNTINVVNLTIRDGAYDTWFFNASSGTIETNITTNATVFLNLTVAANNHFTALYNSINSSIDPFAANLTAYANITVYDIWDNSTVTFNATIYNATHNTAYTNQNQLRPNFQGQHSINISVGGYVARGGIAVNLSNATATALEMWQSNLTIEAYEWANLVQLQTFNATVTAGSQTIEKTTTGGAVTYNPPAGALNLSIIAPMYYVNTSTHTVAALDDSTLNGTLTSSYFTVFAQYIDGTAVDNFTLTVQALNFTWAANYTTTNTSVHFYVVNGTYNLTIVPDDYITNGTTFTVQNFTHTHTFGDLYRVNTVNITFLYEVNLSIVTGHTIFADFISTAASYRFNTTNGTIFQELLSPADYTINYFATDFATRYYEFELANRSYNEFTLYMAEAPTASNVTLTLVDESSAAIEGAEVRALRYDVGSNTYVVVESPVSDFEGKVRLSLELYDTFYQFQIYYEGTLRKTTEPLVIKSTTLDITVVLAGASGGTFYTEEAISYTLNYTESTNNFNFQYADAAGTTSQGCLEVYTQNSKGKTYYNHTCANAASGTLLVHAPEENGTTYIAYGYVVYDNDNHYLAALLKGFGDFRDLGSLGIFFTVMLVMVFALVGYWSPPLAIVLASAAPMLISLTGMNSLPAAANISLLVAGVVVAIVIGKRGGGA